MTDTARTQMSNLTEMINGEVINLEKNPSLESINAIRRMLPQLSEEQQNKITSIILTSIKNSQIDNNLVNAMFDLLENFPHSPFILEMMIESYVVSTYSRGSKLGMIRLIDVLQAYKFLAENKIDDSEEMYTFKRMIDAKDNVTTDNESRNRCIEIIGEKSQKIFEESANIFNTFNDANSEVFSPLIILMRSLANYASVVIRNSLDTKINYLFKSIRTNDSLAQEKRAQLYDLAKDLKINIK